MAYLSYYSRIVLEAQSKTTKIVGIASLRAEIRIRNLPNTKQDETFDKCDVKQILTQNY
jgi:hypothetical protein